MASTNKTSHYELSQFLGTDKPAWLTDYNSDMTKIDAGINTAQSTATGADGKADSANTAIGTLTNLNTQDKTSVVAAINEANTNATTAQNTANSADGKISTLTTKLTLDQIKENLTVTSNLGTVSLNDVKIVHNSDASMAKIYGTVNITNVSGATADVNVTIAGTGLYPTASFTVNGCQLISVITTSNEIQSVLGSYDINSDGTITFTRKRYTNTSAISFQFIACLLFVEDFGD